MVNSTECNIIQEWDLNSERHLYTGKNTIYTIIIIIKITLTNQENKLIPDKNNSIFSENITYYSKVGVFMTPTTTLLLNMSEHVFGRDKIADCPEIKKPTSWHMGPLSVDTTTENCIKYW